MGHVAFRTFQKLSEHSNYFTGGWVEYRCTGDEGNESCRDEGVSVYLALKATVGTCIVGSRKQVNKSLDHTNRALKTK